MLFSDMFERGLGKIIASATEEEIFSVLGKSSGHISLLCVPHYMHVDVPWQEPHQRVRNF